MMDETTKYTKHTKMKSSPFVCFVCFVVLNAEFCRKCHGLWCYVSLSSNRISRETKYENEINGGRCGHVQGGTGTGARSGTGPATGGANRNAALHFQGWARRGPEPAIRGAL